jgi:hypothetical protein
MYCKRLRRIWLYNYDYLNTLKLLPKINLHFFILKGLFLYTYSYTHHYTLMTISLKLYSYDYTLTPISLCLYSYDYILVPIFLWLYSYDYILVSIFLWLYPCVYIPTTISLHLYAYCGGIDISFLSHNYSSCYSSFLLFPSWFRI